MLKSDVSFSDFKFDDIEIIKNNMKQRMSMINVNKPILPKIESSTMLLGTTQVKNRIDNDLAQINNIIFQKLNTIQ